MNRGHRLTQRDDHVRTTGEGGCPQQREASGDTHPADTLHLGLLVSRTEKINFCCLHAPVSDISSSQPEESKKEQKHVKTYPMAFLFSSRITSFKWYFWRLGWQQDTEEIPGYKDWKQEKCVEFLLWGSKVISSDYIITTKMAEGSLRICL